MDSENSPRSTHCHPYTHSRIGCPRLPSPQQLQHRRLPAAVTVFLLSLAPLFSRTRRLPSRIRAHSLPSTSSPALSLAVLLSLGIGRSETMAEDDDLPQSAERKLIVGHPLRPKLETGTGGHGRYLLLRHKLRRFTMNPTSFRRDIDELIDEFAQGGPTTFADMKRVWLSKKFSYIYEASPSTNLAFFMQSLYAHSIGYMVGAASLSHRLGGLYCLYCLYETQPFKPPFRVYLSVGELRKLRLLVADAKANDIKGVPTLVKKMLERNMFLFGSVDLMDGSVTETVNQLQQLQNARIQVAYEKLFDSTTIEHYIHMDLGMETDLNLLKKMSSEYAKAKNIAIEETSNVLDVQNIKHISEDKELLGDHVEKIADEWHVQKQTFYKQTGLGDDEGYGQVLEQLLLQDQDDGQTPES